MAQQPAQEPAPEKTDQPHAQSEREHQGHPAPFRYAAALAARIEAKWQRRWEDQRVFHAPNPPSDSGAGFQGGLGDAEGKPSLFVLDMFPYPSGVGLHVGHPLGYIATDVFARYKRMTGYNVLHAMGYDAFGLPAEQFAVQTGQHPRVTTEANIQNMQRQLRGLGLGHDPRRAVATTDPAYYKWTQWIFLRLYNAWFDPQQRKARPIGELQEAFEAGERDVVSGPGGLGFEIRARAWKDLDEHERNAVLDSYRLAFRDEAPVNWCPRLGTVLANEEVTADGKSERGNFPVYKRPMKQWMLRITSYAQRLLDGLDELEWPEPVKLMQRNWIGKSVGATVRFEIESDGRKKTVDVFTTRPDTVCGATYIVLAPEHPLVQEICKDAWPENIPGAWTGEGQDWAAENRHTTPAAAIAAYRRAVEKKSDRDRQADTKEKTGVFTGAYAVNPASGDAVPVFIADYVLMGYGSGAIMAVPAHDERDFAFAHTMQLPVRDVVLSRIGWLQREFVRRADQAEPFREGWVVAMADFIGGAVSEDLHPGADEQTIDALYSRVAQGREDIFGDAPGHEDQDQAGADPGRGVGRVRGVVREQWLETLRPFGAMRLDEFQERVQTGRIQEVVGAAMTQEGVAVRSPPIEGLPTAQAKHAMARWLNERGAGKATVQFKLRDWLFSRQRYWGEPFPIVYDEQGRPCAVPENMLPVELPDLVDFAPEASDDPDAPPRPPLARAKGWETVAMDIGDGTKNYTRELNTMPQWAGSCWYYLRYLDPENNQRFCDPAVEAYWMGPNKDANKDAKKDQAGAGAGVDLYVGGVEHAVLHLLYARFWHKVLFDLGLVSTAEPFYRLFNQGYIQAAAYTDERGLYAPAEDVQERDGGFFYNDEPVVRAFGKMGKSLKNAVAPDHMCEQYGADTLRLYEMYMGPLEQSKPWNTRDVVGVFRFLQRLWRTVVDEETGEARVAEQPADEHTRRALHKAIAGVADDLAHMRFNTAIAKLIECNNHVIKAIKGGPVPREVAEAMTLMLAPLAPHTAEELWERLGHHETIAYEGFPAPDEALLKEDLVEIPVQVLGKLRGRIETPADAAPDAVEAIALKDPAIQEHIGTKRVRKVIVVPGRMVNIIVG